MPDLMQALSSWANVYAAFTDAARGKRSSAIVAAFDLEAERHVSEIAQSLRSQTYRPQPYHSFLIHDPKRRLVSAAAFSDRVVHHALIRLIEPLYEPRFIFDSYANRKGKGTHAALTRAQGFMRRWPYVLQCDLRQFFPSVDHAVLMQCLGKRIPCGQTLNLCQTILVGGAGVLDGEYEMVYFPGDDLLSCARPRGLPIGNLTSQFWANVLLDELDQFVKHEVRCKGYLRYVDDFLLFSDSKAELWEWKAAIREKLNPLRLSLHERESTVYPVKNGIPFLGMRLFTDYRRLKSRNAHAFEARMREWQIAVAAGELTLEEVQIKIAGWVAHAAHANTAMLREQIFQKYTFNPPRKS
jgi:RNA-directed DNA polymerase